MANEVRKTDKFDAWLIGLKNELAKAAIAARITRIEGGLLGDHKDLGGGLTEFRIHVGPGYRLYSAKQGKAIVLLLCGGDKSGQKADIAVARTMIQVIEAARKATKKKK